MQRLYLIVLVVLQRGGLIPSNDQYYKHAKTLVVLLARQAYYKIVTYQWTSPDRLFDFLCSQNEVITGRAEITGNAVNIFPEESIRALHDYTG